MRRNRNRVVSIVTTAAVIGLAPAILWASAGDHPLVSRYPDSKIAKSEVKDYDVYELVVGLDIKEMTFKGQKVEDMTFKGQKVEGRLTRIVYTNPTDRSTLEIFRNYLDAMRSAGAEILYQCEINACGKAPARSAWNGFNGLFSAADGDPRYFAAHLTKGNAEAYVAVMVGKLRTQLDVVEVKGMETALVAVDPSALARDIERAGSARIYGILFDVDKADIRPESKPALDAIAALLNAQPTLSIFVVGHTDSSGELDHDLALSAARARAAATALTKEYGIAAERLDAQGVGPLAPVAPNTTDAGRQLNRRLELVAR
jgi:outer membrane protein OmpA-like peptidoglycan-associated protein